MIPASVEKYLNDYSMSAWEVEASRLDNISTVVVVPAICEFSNIKNLLSSLAENDKKYFGSTLILFVINNSISSPVEIKDDNKKSIALIREIIKRENPGKDELNEKIIDSGLNIGLTDASTAGRELPEKDAGVGLARKIGMDLALKIFNYNTNKKQIICGLDADCIVEKNYLSEVVENFNNRNLSAAVIKYGHVVKGTGEESKAIICYEIFLRYYELGLKFAGSPFAFHTIGSTIVCDFESYIKAGGMNKRKAAEDFYFLEKLAKNFPVERINSTIVHPSARSSWRVPFGTGQRVSRFLSKAQNEYLLFDPDTFSILKKWLDTFLYGNYFDTGFLISAAESIEKRFADFLRNQKFEEYWQNILKNSKTFNQINKQKVNWFDGFRTMKLIHYLRDNGYPQINMFDALDKFFEMYKCLPETEAISVERKNQPVPSFEIQMKYLTLLRQIS